MWENLVRLFDLMRVFQNMILLVVGNVVGFGVDGSMDGEIVGIVVVGAFVGAKLKNNFSGKFKCHSVYKPQKYIPV